MGMEDDGLDDIEEWEQSPCAPAVVDAVGEFNRCLLYTSDAADE